MYGINSATSGFIHTSNTERGAKSHATRNGYNNIYYCCPRSWVVVLEATKVNGKWVNEVYDNLWEN